MSILLAVPAAALRDNRIPPDASVVLPIEFVADGGAAADAGAIVVVLICGNLAVETKTVEIGIHDEVDDARDRVRTVHRRCAAGEDFDALQHRSGDNVDVARLGGRLRIARREAAAVDQGQRALRAEIAKVDFRGARSRGSEGPSFARRSPTAAG